MRWPIPKSQGVVCHLAYFNRSFIDRLSQGNWFEDPSYSALDCSVTGPITIGDIQTRAGGEEIFKEGRSLIWKSLRVTRVYDQANNSLIYLAHAREIQQGSRQDEPVGHSADRRSRSPGPMARRTARSVGRLARVLPDRASWNAMASQPCHNIKGFRRTPLHGVARLRYPSDKR